MTDLSPEILNQIVPFSGTPEHSTTEMIAAGQALQQTKTAYTTAVAVQKPRQISRIAANVIEESKLAGANFYYRWEVFDKQKNRKVAIQGPSIDLAMCIARNYGNCVLDVESSENSSHYMMKGVFIDLETGFTCPRLFRQRKKQNISGKMDADRQEDIVFQIGQSKAIRNAIVRAMPSWLIDKAIETAQKAELSGIQPENIAYARAKVLDFFSGYSITAEQIEAERGRKADQWTPQDIVDLRGMASALKEGRISPQELFADVGPKEGETQIGDNQAATTSKPVNKQKTQSDPKQKTQLLGEGMNEPQLWELLKNNVADAGVKSPESFANIEAYIHHNVEATGKPVVEVLRVAVNTKPTDLMISVTDWHTRKNQANRQQSEPTGASRYSGANSRPPEGTRLDGSKKDNSVWDPRTQPLMGKYYPEKRDAVLKAAEEMGIPTNDRTPKEVHADILGASEEPPEDHSGSQGEGSPEVDINAIRDAARSLRENNADRWAAIVRTLSRDKQISTTFIEGMKADELRVVIDEFNAVDEDQEKF